MNKIYTIYKTETPCDFHICFKLLYVQIELIISFFIFLLYLKYDKYISHTQYLIVFFCNYLTKISFSESKSSLFNFKTTCAVAITSFSQ